MGRLTLGKSMIQSYSDGKVFSTKEAAEKWIDENKPIFSKKQISDILNSVIDECKIDNPWVFTAIDNIKEKLKLN